MNGVDDKVFTEQTNMMSKFRWVQTRSKEDLAPRLQFVKLKRNVDHVLIKARTGKVVIERKCRRIRFSEWNWVFE